MMRSLLFLFLLSFAIPAIADDVNSDRSGDGFPSGKTNAQEPSDQSASEASLGDKYQKLDDLFVLYQPYLGNIGPYEPIYFIVGTQPEKSKFQISLKYRFFNAEGSWSKANPWLQGFHFAYTQTSFWDLKSDSKPFEDTSYKPELFFLSSHIPIKGLEGSRFFIQCGLQHESNGRSGLESRAADYVYLKPIFIYYHRRSHMGFSVAPKVWGYLSDESGDLRDYRGFFDLELKFGKADSVVVETHFCWARQGGSYQIDLTYPLHRLFNDNLNLYFQVQYANALAESLIHYKQRTEALRVGFAFIR